MMDIEFLRKFCGPVRGLGEMSAPFNWQGYTYATNGYILIRVPFAAGVLSSFVPPPGFQAIIQLLEQEPAEWVSCPIVVEPPSEKCPVCDGTGTAYLCPECGEGLVEISTPYNYYGERDCKSCAGKGQIPKDEVERMQRQGRESFEVVTGPCESCTDGSIYHVKGVAVGRSFFSDRYLNWLGQLPSCEVGVTGPESIALFRFVGGRGAIMPRREGKA